MPEHEYILYRRWSGSQYYSETRTASAESLTEALAAFSEWLRDPIGRPVRDGELLIVALSSESARPLHLFRAEVSAPTLTRIGEHGEPINEHGNRIERRGPAASGGGDA